MEYRETETKTKGKVTAKKTATKPKKGSYEAVLAAAKFARSKNLENYAR
ncbi:MAG TPA: hypothetical protein PKJ70_03860 [Chitinophagaceae bacterium]|nr:hypothetical protein [Chitinophagaceae bacterium]MCC6634579.1 hypothetical protein [Chitinophagaceae bacterium]HNM33697.1 hypothetical protein [Chitinophagaceae bacterium]HNN31008.1 hypothetical protein [Chitinophagaceae bacterium]